MVRTLAILHLLWNPAHSHTRTHSYLYAHILTHTFVHSHLQALTLARRHTRTQPHSNVVTLACTHVHTCAYIHPNTHMSNHQHKLVAICTQNFALACESCEVVRGLSSGYAEAPTTTLLLPLHAAACLVSQHACLWRRKEERQLNSYIKSSVKLLLVGRW